MILELNIKTCKHHRSYCSVGVNLCHDFKAIKSRDYISMLSPSDIYL